MKRIYIKSIELQNFKATNSRAIELPPSGIVVAGWNGSGKSSVDSNRKVYHYNN